MNQWIVAKCYNFYQSHSLIFNYVSVYVILTLTGPIIDFNFSQIKPE